MRLPRPTCTFFLCFALVGLLSNQVHAGDVLSTNGFQSCLQNGTIQVQKMNVQFDHSTNRVNFDVAGTSTKQQNVTANLEVMAYGKVVYQKEFDPCGTDPHVDQLCPGQRLTSIDSFSCSRHRTCANAAQYHRAISAPPVLTASPSNLHRKFLTSPTTSLTWTAKANWSSRLGTPTGPIQARTLLAFNRPSRITRRPTCQALPGPPLPSRPRLCWFLRFLPLPLLEQQVAPAQVPRHQVPPSSKSYSGSRALR